MDKRVYGNGFHIKWAGIQYDFIISRKSQNTNSLSSLSTRLSHSHALHQHASHLAPRFSFLCRQGPPRRKRNCFSVRCCIELSGANGLCYGQSL